MAKAAMTQEQVEAFRVFASCFVLPQAKVRALTLLETSRGRRTLFAELDHFRWLDPRFAKQVPPGEQSPECIERLLREHGAPPSCHVMSTKRELNGRAMLLRAALAEIVAGGHGSIVFCIPGQLAYYESEEPFERYICHRDS
jgi:hypothetical protein